MEGDQQLQTNEINDVPDVDPIRLPGRDMNPTLDDRITHIESVLNIN